MRSFNYYLKFKIIILIISTKYYANQYRYLNYYLNYNIYLFNGFIKFEARTKLLLKTKM